MTNPLLTTKLHLPRARRRLVPRPRLVEQLNEGLDRKLTLVCAPAGFGKTTLVSEWVHVLGAHRDAPLQVAWLSLDEGDNDLTRFLSYCIAALQTIEADLAKGALSALQSPVARRGGSWFASRPTPLLGSCGKLGCLLTFTELSAFAGTRLVIQNSVAIQLALCHC